MGVVAVWIGYNFCCSPLSNVGKSPPFGYGGIHYEAGLPCGSYPSYDGLGVVCVDRSKKRTTISDDHWRRVFRYQKFRHMLPHRHITGVRLLAIIDNATSSP